MIELDLLQFQEQLQFRREGKRRLVFDPVRKKYLVATPEELVRQLLVCYLVEIKNYNKNQMALEKALKVNGMLRRWDLLIYDQQTRPVLLIECKAPKVNVNQKTFEQIARYNLSLQVPFLLVTNGRQSYCCQIDFEDQSFSFLNEIPNPEDLNSI